MNLIERINTHEFLYLVQIDEPEDNALRLILQEVRANIPPQQSPPGQAPARSWGSIIPMSDCAIYEIVFKSCIVYSVWDESLSLADESEVFTGRFFRIYSKSRFLEYVSREVLALDFGNDLLYPGPYQHFAIVCLNHIVNVASVDQPSIVILKGI